MDNNLINQTDTDININEHIVNAENNPESPNTHRTNNHDQLTTRLIQELNRSNNEEIQNLLRRVLLMRESILSYQMFDMEESFFNILISNYMLIFSAIAFLISFIFLYTQSINLFINKQLPIKYLESDEMFYVYLIGLFALALFLWSFYLIIFKLFSFFDSYTIFSKENMSICSSAELLFFNPFYTNLVIIHYNKNYLANIFDFYLIMTIALVFWMNYFFTYYYYNYLKKKITGITNIHLYKNKLVYIKIKLFYLFLIGMNLFMSYLISFFNEHSEFYFLYLLQIKSIYLIIRQLGMWYETETNYNQINSHYATNEDYYLKTLLIKTILNVAATVSNLKIFFIGHYRASFGVCKLFIFQRKRIFIFVSEYACVYYYYVRNFFYFEKI
jgi:hypothetical protein